ncbi:Mur ligase family protein [Desnuesiella massiliensis]|uniref:Mur ligase family protein n=1 Tax=Desnuesiella massiliensis TaxID=1650662 RepID=UPI0006E367B2|nr:Mur ligase family protein [Desnuesiella massiliensis]
MSKINIRTIFSIIVSKTVLRISQKFLKGGSNFPGRVALKLSPSILKDISKKYKVILITGTNGKTTTTSMIYNIFKENGFNTITNSTGANMLPGIVSCFIENYSFNKKEIKYAVIEVDEANVKFITEYLYPEVITITNLFRDQLDRYGEVYTTLNKILEGINKSPSSKLVLNGDESLLGNLELKNQSFYYGFETPINDSKEVEINADAKFCKCCKAPYDYEFVTYNHLGNFYCSNCGYKRPLLNFSVNSIKDINAEFSEVKINHREFLINQPGVYNIYNALCAYSIAKIYNIDDKIIYSALENQKSSFGRQETIHIDGKEVKIVLVKNPAGYNQAIDTLCLNDKKIGAAFMLNDNYADGRDVSWIWDVNFEKIKNLNIDQIFISGLRTYDMAVRLKIAGLEESKFIIKEDFDDLLDSIKSSSNQTIYILATYTAMINFRKSLYSKGYIQKLW